MVIPIKIWTKDVEEEALKQLNNIASLPWAFHHKEAVSPAAVGVNIGCGMGAVKTSLRADDLPE